MKYIKLLLVVALIMTTFTGCFGTDIKDINDEVIETFEVIKAEDGDSSIPAVDRLQDSASQVVNAELDAKFAVIEFYNVAGVYSRKVLQDDVEVLEMFAQDRNSFLRVASDNTEQEVYAYNYVTDEFTYLYYFDSELISKTVINVTSGKVKKDDGGYAELIAGDASDLKDYFNNLINTAGITIDELKG